VGLKEYRRLGFVLLATALLLDTSLAWKNRDLVRKGYPDFTTFYSAGKIVRSGLAAYLYEDSVQFRTQQKFAPDVIIRHGALPYIHSPFEALLFIPLTFVPYFSAYRVWNLLNALMLAGTLMLLRSHLLPPKAFAISLVASLAYFPVFICLLQGQDLILVLLLFALVYVSLENGRDHWAGVWLGLATFRPQLAIPLALILIFNRRVRTFIAFAISTAAVTAVSIAVVGWREFLEYPKYVWGLEQKLGYGAILPTAMPNLRGLVAIFVRDGYATSLSLTILGSLLLLILAIRQFRRAELADRLDLGFGFAVTIAVLISYHAFVYDLTLLLLPLLAVIHSHRDRLHVHWTIALPMALLFCTPVMMILWLWLGRLNYFVPVLLLFAWGIMREISSLQAVPARRAQPA
jgi:hypothetical protein